ncbi:MAG: RNA polymerase sigma factor [Phycisphaerales bacterium JB040]
MSTTAERTVLERVASQEDGAFDELTRQFGGLVWTLSRRMCPTRQDAEDAMQDIFLEVWKSAGRYDPRQGSEATFVATIARRRLIDRLRRSGRRPDTAALIEGAEPPGVAGEPDTDGAELSEESRRARAALRMLSEEQQRVLQLAIFHGMSHDKISTSTGLPLGTVKAHIRRGLIRLREILAQQQEKDARDGRAGTEVSR